MNFNLGHTVRTFALTTKSTRKERVIETMGVMGPAVMLGVAFTNLPGIICLHWASGKIFFLFFDRKVISAACRQSVPNISVMLSIDIFLTSTSI